MLDSDRIVPWHGNRFQSEIEFILCTLGGASDNEDFGRIQALAKRDLDWNYLVRTTLKHSITALFFHSLTRLAPDSIPTEIASAAAIFTKRQRDVNQLMTQELARVLAALKTQGIAAMPFKGPLLSVLAYADVGLRSFRDLDFLIHRQDLRHCLKVLQSLDYMTDLGLSPAQEAAFQDYSGQDLFHRKDQRVALEPHWAFGPSNLVMAIDYQGIWDRAQPFDLEGTQVLSLSPEDLITVLCVHGSKELWSRLRLICDVSRTLDAFPATDWEAVISRARNQRCLNMLLLGLKITSQLLGTSIPPQAMSLLDSNPKLEDLARRVETFLFNENYQLPSPYSLSHFRLRMHDQLSDQLLYLARTIAIPRYQHFQMIRLPDSIFFVYYPLKLIHDYLLLPLWRGGKFLLGSRKKSD